MGCGPLDNVRHALGFSSSLMIDAGGDSGGGLGNTSFIILCSPATIGAAGLIIQCIPIVAGGAPVRIEPSFQPSLIKLRRSYTYTNSLRGSMPANSDPYKLHRGLPNPRSISDIARGPTNLKAVLGWHITTASGKRPPFSAPSTSPRS